MIENLPDKEADDAQHIWKERGPYIHICQKCGCRLEYKHPEKCQEKAFPDRRSE